MSPSGSADSLPGLEAALEPVEVPGHPEFAVVEADLRLEK
jgi:hypothetical protein